MLGAIPDDKGPSPPASAYRSPVDRFAHLPEHIRRFIEGLDEEDCQALNDFLLQYKRARTIGWFFKWLVAGAAALFLAMVALGEAVEKASLWFGSTIGKP